MADVLYFNGRFTTTDEKVIGVEDRGFLFGDAVYEVFAFVRKRPLLLEGHFRRLQKNLVAMEIPQPFSDAQFTTVTTELLARTTFDDGIVYIEITRGDGERSHFWQEDLRPTVVIYSRAYRFPDAGRKREGIGVVTMPDQRWTLSRLKTVNLLPNAFAKKKAQRAGAGEALMLLDGHVTEGASSNFFAVKNGGLVTHPLDDRILPGTVRDHVIRLALTLRIRVDERPLREEELFDVEEAFITSTTQSVMPVTRIDGRVVSTGERGPVTERIQRAFDELVAV